MLVEDRQPGEGVCRAYVANQTAPAPGGAFEPNAGGAAGAAEAVIALAEIERRRGVRGPAWRRAVETGRWLLSHQYRPADAPWLGRAENLMGGWRDRPWSLDVRIDAVQHVACALLGVEQLLADAELPGAMP